MINHKGKTPNQWKYRNAEELYRRLSASNVYDRTQVSKVGKYPIIDQSETGFIGYVNTIPEFHCSLEEPLTTFANHTCAVRQMTQTFGVIQNVFPLKANDGVSQEFLYQLIRGAVRQNGYKGHYPELREMQFLIPPLVEQQKIATILSSVDNVIEKTRAQIDKLKDLKTGMMQELLTKGIGHTEFKDSSVGRIPKSWRAGTLSEFVEINPRLAQRSELQEKTLVSFIRMEDVSDRSVVENVRVVMYEQVSKGFTAFQNQDVLLAKITPCFENGKGGFVDNLHSGVGFGSTEFHVLRAKENVSPHFVYQLINNPGFRIKGAANMTGSAGQRRVPTDYLKSYEIAFPPLIEQQKIVKILQSIDSNISAENQKLISVEQTKKALMQDLLTGKVHVACTT